jgi:hypothetical protein
VSRGPQLQVFAQRRLDADVAGTSATPSRSSNAFSISMARWKSSTAQKVISLIIVIRNSKARGEHSAQ